MITTTTSIDVTCPDWCERDDHYADEEGPGESPLHYGPTFGPFWVQAVVGSPFEVVVDNLHTDERSPAGLRQVAHHAITLAEWLEAHR